MWKLITLLCILLLSCVSFTLTREDDAEEVEEEMKKMNRLKKLLNQISKKLNSSKEAHKRNEQKRRPKGDRKSTHLNNEVSPDGKPSSSSDQRKTESLYDNPKSYRGKIQPYKGKQDKTKSSGGKPPQTKIRHLLAGLNKWESKSSKTKSKPRIGKSNSAHVKVKPSNGKQGKTGSSTFKKTLTGDQNQQSRGQTTLVKEVDSNNSKSSRVTQSKPSLRLRNQLSGRILLDKTRQRKVAKSSDTKSSGRSSDTYQDHVKKHNQYDQYNSGYDESKDDDNEDDLRSIKGKSKRKDDDDKEDDLRSRKGKSKRKDDDDKEDDLRSRKGKSKRKDDEDDLRSRKGKSKRKDDDDKEDDLRSRKGKSKRKDDDDKEDDLRSRKANQNVDSFELET